MEGSLDGRLLKLNKSLLFRGKKTRGRPQGDLYDWVERVLPCTEDADAEEQDAQTEEIVQSTLQCVKDNLPRLKTIAENDVKLDILRVVVMCSTNLVSGEEVQSIVSEYLTGALVTSTSRALKNIVYMSMSAVRGRAPHRAESKFFDTVLQDVDECNVHALRWIASNTSVLPSPVTSRMVASLRNLLFRSVASVPLLEKAAVGLLNLACHHGADIALSSELNRCQHYLSTFHLNLFEPSNPCYVIPCALYY